MSTEPFPLLLAQKMARKRVGQYRAKGCLRGSFLSGDDLEQEGVLRAWRDWSHYDPSKSKPSTWIHLCVWRGMSEALRRSGKLLRQLPEGKVPRVESREGGWQEVIQGRELLEKLKGRDREWVVGHFERKTYRELGENSGVSIKRVHQKVKEVLEKMREEFAHG